MSEPKALLEAALYSLLNTGLTPEVYNTQAAAGAAFNYVVFQAAGGDDVWYHAKERGYVYEYQIVGIHTTRAQALAMNAAIEAAMDGAKAGLSVSGFGVVRVTRDRPIDYTQVTPDNETIHFVGGIYQIELEVT